MFIREISVCNGVSLSGIGRKRQLTLEKLLSMKKVMALIFITTLFLSAVPFLITFHIRLHHPQHIFIFSWCWYLGWLFGHLKELLCFPCIQEVYVLLNFCLFFFCQPVLNYKEVLAKNLER